MDMNKYNAYLENKSMKSSFKLNKFFRWFFQCSLVALFTASSQFVFADNHKTNKEIVFGVLPMLSTEKLITRFSPMVDYLSTELGVKIRFETAPDYPAFIQRSNEGKRYDFMFTAPHMYYLAQRKGGYKAIVRVAAPDMKAIIVVPKKSSIKTLEDLKGKRVSTTSPVALATLMIKAHLKKSGIDPEKDVSLVYTPTHNASLVSAYKGITDAGSLMFPPFKRAKKEIKQSVRVISVTDGSPHMPLAVADRLDKKLVVKLKNSLLQLKSSEKGRALLKQLRWPGFVGVKPQDYDTLKWAVDELK